MFYWLPHAVTQSRTMNITCCADLHDLLAAWNNSGDKHSYCAGDVAQGR